jgi:hypothetical protein
MMKWTIFTLIGVLAVVLLNLKHIMAEVSLKTPLVASDEERSWVDGFRIHVDVLLPSGNYRFVRTYSNGDTMDATYLIDADTQSVTITGKITTGDFVKDIFANAQYSIEGAVIDYYDATGHVQLFPDAGHVLTMLPDNKLVLRSQYISLSSF